MSLSRVRQLSMEAVDPVMISLPATATLRITPVGTFHGSRPAGLAVTGAMLGLMSAGLVTGALGLTFSTVAILVAGQLLDHASLLRAPGLHGLMLRSGFDLNARTLVRLASVAILATVVGSAWEAAAAWAAWLLWYAAGATERLARIAMYTSRSLAGRGLPELDELPEPPQAMSPWPYAALVAVLALINPVVGAVAIGLTAIARAAVAAKAVLAERRAQNRRRKQVNQALLEYQPEVILLGTGKVQQMYQVNMWLPVLDRLNRKALVVLQSTSGKHALAPSRTPVLCVEDQADLLHLNLDSAKLALYSANAGTNIQLLRLPHLRHAFIGHGDSDKFASQNPFAKVYDEIWVAGQAGEDRYATAGVQIPHEAFVHVGRPQLDGFGDQPGPRAGETTILYAPTWEGWTAEEHHSSLVQIGPELVRRIQRDHPDVRILFRPHPMTGTRDRRAAAALDEVRRLLPEADVMMPGSCDVQDSLAAADLLICDVSSVLSDYLATGRPYAVPNLTPEDYAGFVAANPTAAAAYPLNEELDGLEAALDAAREVARGRQDELAGERDRLRTYVLGPDAPQEAFEKAVEHSIDQSLYPVR